MASSGTAEVSGADTKGEYAAFLRYMIDNNKCDVDQFAAKLERRFYININDLRAFKSSLSNRLTKDPITQLPLLEKAITEEVLDKNPDFFKQIALRDFKSADIDPRHDRRVPVGIEGNFGPSAVSPRTLAAHFLSTLVKLEGIVTKVSIMKPKLTKSVHFCPKTSKTMNRVYSDVYDLGGLPTAGQMPTQDEDKNPLEQEFGRSVYKDTQTFTIQEMPEAAPCGQLPRSTEVYVEADLICDETVVKPGDRVAIVGIYRAIDRGGGIAGKARFTSAQIKTVLIGNSVQKLKKDAANIILSTEDVSNIKKFSKRSDAFTLLARSLAPSIYGHREVKQALALMLLGGREHNLRNGTHLRGDINILMVGDPSTAKSQLLRFVYNIASNPVQTTGRGSSGVGLTAAVTTDPETGERRLEAGAMVLADRGVVCIDEFDKMSDADRVAIHEVMEQQTVTISKAGIHASLNARCSVVAAANPVYGRFDPTLPLSKNVALPDSLMSRFDVFFVMQDVPSSSRDKRLAGHVLRMHRTVIPGFEGIPLPANIGSRSNDIEDRYKSDARDDERDEKTAVFQKFNPLLHGAAREEMGEDGVDDATAAAERDSLILNLEFMRKYIYYAKSRTPTLTESAREAIVDAYVSFRERVAGRKVAITARSLETLIRLATAHAKSRLSDTVGRQDARVAEGILRFALYGDKAAIAGEEGGETRDENGGGGDEDEDDFKGVQGASAARERTARARPAGEAMRGASDAAQRASGAGAGGGAERSRPEKAAISPIGAADAPDAEAGDAGAAGRGIKRLRADDTALIAQLGLPLTDWPSTVTVDTEKAEYAIFLKALAGFMNETLDTPKTLSQLYYGTRMHLKDADRDIFVLSKDVGWFRSYLKVVVDSGILMEVDGLFHRI